MMAAAGLHGAVVCQLVVVTAAAGGLVIGSVLAVDLIGCCVQNICEAHRPFMTN